ncbi:flagellin, partial [Pseudomonas putida]|uniref:flagellin hook IN motif-containing protein n=1 Tax=Pseudomonas putida TaxID=303 RepID=UPI0023647650
GETSKLAATVTGSPASAVKESYSHKGNYAAPDVGADADSVKMSIAGTDITLKDKATLDEAIVEINKHTATTGVTASKDAAELVLSSDTAFSVQGKANGTNSAAVPAVKTTGLTAPLEISINGTSVKAAKGDDMAKVLKAINDQKATTGVTAVEDKGRLMLSSVDGKAIKLDNGPSPEGAGALAKLGLTAGSSQAKLTTDTSVILNGVDVKFKKGDT